MCYNEGMEENNTNTITFKHKTYTPWKAHHDLMLWYTNSRGTNTPWGYEFKIIATDADGEVRFVGYNYEHLMDKIRNGESGYGDSDIEAVVKYIKAHG